MNDDYQRIAKAIHYLHGNALRQPALEDVAAHLQLSPAHCQRLFKRWAGISPKRFLQLLTLEQAKRMLGEGATTLEAAYGSGLSSVSRLHDHFVTLEAMTPGQYQCQYQGKRNGEPPVVIRHGVYPSPFGDVWLAVTERGICAMIFIMEDDAENQIRQTLAQWPRAETVRDDQNLARLVKRIFNTDKTSAEPLRLHVQGTNFQVQVWKALLRIPEGRVYSYGQLAAALGKPEATRAVASAVARNPVGYLIPCHRVIRNTGAIGEYHWGAVRKQAMLVWEAARAGL
jgi:AraC family transcriptional regulator of adaptative response/methylated-DNA-[protein]-cysteine methyltransferase